MSLNASYPVRIAIERNIPSIIWGQLQTIEQVGMFSHNDFEMTKWSQLEHDRLGSDIEDLIGNGAQVNPKSILLRLPCECCSKWNEISKGIAEQLS